MINDWWPVRYGHRDDAERELAARHRRTPTRHSADQDADLGREDSMTSTAHYLTVAESAVYLNTSVRFVRRLIAERRIAFHHVGRHVRIALDDLEAFMQAGRVEPMTEADVWRDLRGVGA